MKFIALIPSYEPTDVLISLTKELVINDFEVVIVNDGSDNTYDKIFKECANYAVVLSYKENHGKGYALKYGLSFIYDNYKNYTVVTMDSDGQHTIKDAVCLCKKVTNNKIVLGKRLRDKHIPLRSKLGNAITRKVYEFKTGLKIYDTQTGLRAFNKSVIPFLLSVNGDRFEYEMNVLLSAKSNNINLIEETIDTIYINNNRGSHFRTFKDSYMIYKQIIKYNDNEGK